MTRCADVRRGWSPWARRAAAGKLCRGSTTEPRLHGLDANLHLREAFWSETDVLLPFARRIDPAFVEVHGLSGDPDLLIQVVASDADDLYRIAGQILDIRGVRRTSTSLVMRQLVDYRLTQLLRRDS